MEKIPLQRVEVCLEVSFSWWQDFPPFSLKARHTSRLIYLSCSSRTSFADVDLKQNKWNALAFSESLNPLQMTFKVQNLSAAHFAEGLSSGPLLVPQIDSFIFLFPQISKCLFYLGYFIHVQGRNQKWEFRNTFWSEWNCLPLNKERWFDWAMMLYGMNRNWSTWYGASFIILTLSMSSDLTNFLFVLPNSHSVMME